jgi:hypothetical protein
VGCPSALAEEAEDAARPEAEAAPAPRPYATGTFGLELEGILIGLLKTLQGRHTFPVARSDRQPGISVTTADVNTRSYLRALKA